MWNDKNDFEAKQYTNMLRFILNRLKTSSFIKLILRKEECGEWSNFAWKLWSKIQFL